MNKFGLIFKYSLFFISATILAGIILYFSSYPFSFVFTFLIILAIIYSGTLWLINREIIRPLKETSFISKEISDHHTEPGHEEDFSEKISEVRRISEKLDELVNRRFITKEIHDIYNSLLSINERLISELNTAKIFKVNRNEFFGNVAHELRTPIFAIQLSLETLIDGAVHDKSVNLDFLHRAEKQTERLKDLVNDLMTISKYESGVKLSKRYFGLSEHISGIIGEMKGIADNKKISIQYIPELRNGIQVFGDSESLKQVFINLIDNSIKYTPENGKIIIRTKEESKDVLISVEDNGSGIPEKDIPRIFERFYRVDKNRSRDRGGTGLGLSIVNHILEVHDSKIKVESEEICKLKK